MLQGLQNRAATAVGLAPPFQDGAIAGANRQGRDLHHSIRTGLKNHPHHTQGNADALEHEPLIQGPVHLTLSQGIRQLRQLANAGNGPIELGAIELEPRQQGRGELFLLGGLQIRLVGRQDHLPLLLQGIGHRPQGVLTLLIAALRQVNGMAPQARSAGQQFRGGIGNGLIQRLGRGTAMHHPWRPGRRSNAKRAAPKRPAPLPRLAGAITRS